MLTVSPYLATPSPAPVAPSTSRDPYASIPNRRLEPATKIGEEHRLIDRVKLAGKLAGGLTTAGVAIPLGLAKGVAATVATPDGRAQLKHAALVGGVLTAGVGLALGAVFGAALLGPVGAVLQGVKGAVAGFVAGAAIGTAGRLTTNGIARAAHDVPEGWRMGVDLGERAAVRGIGSFAAGMIWLGEHSKTLHRLGMAISRLGQTEPTGTDHQRVLQVDTQVWRSAQPGPDVWPDLAARGFKSVVNLRMETDYEADAVKAAGLSCLYLPESPLKAPTIEQALEFLKFVTDPGNQPVLFHCFSGVDRTGTMAACYRIAVQGWPQDQALAECLQNGMMAELQQDKIRFIKQFNTAWHEMQANGTAPELH